ncbi:MAG: c-type cytochrome [Gammaproteobacteria bacterium]|nr:c-type cytochrome [Gammaproteobacteria bacterium]
MKLSTSAILALALVGVALLPACQTTKTDTPKATPITAAAAANMGNNCFSCHGPEGKSPGSIPSLNGKGADAIVKTMNDFKSGTRPSTVMGRHAKGYTDAEIAAIASYISSFK